MSIDMSASLVICKTNLIRQQIQNYLYSELTRLNELRRQGKLTTGLFESSQSALVGYCSSQILGVA